MRSLVFDAQGMRRRELTPLTPMTHMSRNDKRFPGAVRIAALVALLAGAAGSVAFMVRAGQRTPTFLLIIMIAWVLAPLVALAWATAMSPRWSIPMRWTLCVLSVALSTVSPAIYGEFIDVAPRGSAYAARFVMTPVLSWLLIAIAVASAAIISRKRATAVRRKRNGR